MLKRNSINVHSNTPRFLLLVSVRYIAQMKAQAKMWLIRKEE